MSAERDMVAEEGGPAVLVAPRSLAPPGYTGDAVILYYLQTRSRQEAGLFRFQPK